MARMTRPQLHNSIDRTYGTKRDFFKITSYDHLFKDNYMVVIDEISELNSEIKILEKKLYGKSTSHD